MQLAGSVFLIRGKDTSAVLAFLEQEGTVMQGNPDVYARTYGIFGIDDAHELTARSLGRPMGSEERVFIICATAMTTEAQNALLKTIEEPPGNARFFFVLPSPETLLATLRSRAQVHSFDDTSDADEAAARKASAFLAAAPATRLDLLKPLLEKGDDDRRDIGAVIAFLSSLEQTLSLHPLKKAGEGLAAVYIARKYLGDKGALVKPLLESVALLAPRI